MTARGTALFLLVLLVGAAALAFGSVEPWAGEGLRFLALLVFALTIWRHPLEAVRARPVAALLLPGVALLLWAGVQLLPVPRGVLAAVAPKTAALYRDAVPSPRGGEVLPAWLLARAPAEGATVDPGARAWKGPQDEGDPSVGRTASIHPAATRGALLNWGTMLLLFVSAAALARDPGRRYRLVWGVAGWTGMLGVLAVMQSVTWNYRVLWLRRVPEEAEPLGPFVNRNHFAGFVEMGTLVALGLLLAILARSEGRLSAAGIRAALRDHAWAMPRALLVALFAILGVGGLLLAGSRGGALAFAVGVLTLALVGVRKTRAWLSFAALALALLGLGAGLAAWVAPDRTALQEVPFVTAEADPSASLRADAYARTLRILKDNPLTGTGLGTFRWAYARYERQGEWMSMAQAHNDFLQLVSDTGLPGLAILVWALVAFGWRVLRPALGEKDVPRWTTAAAAAAVLAMIFHSVLDFSLQVPAVAALFAVLVGILAAAGEDGRQPEATEDMGAGRAWGAVLVRVGLVALLGVQAVHATGVVRHDADYSRGVEAFRDGRFSHALSRLESARGHWDASPMTWEWSGDAALRLYGSPPGREWTDEEAQSILRRAWQGYAGAVLRSPAQSWSWGGLAEVATHAAALSERAGVDLAEIGWRSRGVLDERRAVALAAARLATRLKPSGFQELDALAGVYQSIGDAEAAQRALMLSARMMPAPSFHVWGQGERLPEPQYRAVLQALEEGIERAPAFERSLLHREIGLFARTHADFPTVIRHLETAERLAGYPMERHLAVSDLARVLESLGHGEEAADAYRRALALGFAPAVDAQLLGSLELRLGNATEACAALRTALRHDSDRPGLREHAASACEQAGEIEIAESLLQEGLQDPLRTPETATAILDLYWRTGRRSSALQLASQWQRDFPDMAALAGWIDRHRTPAPPRGADTP